MKTKLVLALLLLALPGSWSGSVFAATAPDTLVSSHERIRVSSADSARKGLETLVNIDADDAFLPKILAVLSEISGYNVVAGPEVNNKQRISIHLKNSPIEEAVNLVVRAAGLSYEIVGNSFLVTEQSNLKNEVGVVSYLLELKYAKAREVKELLKDITKSIQVDTAHNAILVSTSPKAISEIRKIVEKVDIPSKQIMLQTRLVEVSVDHLEELGVDWEKLSKLTTIIAENPKDITEGGRAPTESEIGDFSLGQKPTKQIYQKIDGLNDIGYFSRQLTAFDITIDWLLKNNLGKLLTDAKLTAMNNRKATIHIGEIIPYVIQSQMNAQVERDSIGIRIDITPQVNNDGGITLNLRPEVSNFIELINGTVPRKKIRTAETTVLVRDKQKIVIAGLISETEKTTIHKIPFFGDLLFFGKFFQHLVKEQNKTDLIIEITPYILNNADTTNTLAAQANSLRDSLERLKNVIKDSTEFGMTHLCFMPTTSVLKPFQFSVGIREIAVGQLNGFQIGFSPVGTLGKQRLSVKYQWRPKLALGAGYRWGKGEESRFIGRQVGVFAVGQIVKSQFLEWYGILDGEAGNSANGGFGTGGSLHFGRYLGLIGDVSFSYRDDKNPYWTILGGGAVRFQWPWLPTLSGAIGIKYATDNLNQNFADINTFNAWRWADKLYFDLAYSGIF